MNIWPMRRRIPTNYQLTGIGADRPLRQEWWFVATVLALLALGSLRLFLSIKGAPLNSDDVMPAMLFESLQKGLSNGWVFTPDTFLISDLPLYVVSSLVFGLRTSTIWGTAITLSSFSLLIIVLAINKAIGQMEALIFAIIFTTPFIIGKASYVLLATPFIHVMTIGFSIWLASVVITGFFDSLSINWARLTMLAVLASLMELSDPFLFFIFVIPMGVVGLWYAMSNRNRKSALKASLFLIEATILLGILERLLVERLGNVILSLYAGVTPGNLLWYHVRLLVACALNLLGANFIGHKWGPIFLLDLVKLAAIGYFLMYTLYKYRMKRLETPRQAFIAFVTIMSVVIVFAFILSGNTVDIYSQRYLFPAVIGVLILVSLGMADHFQRWKKVFPVILIVSGLWAAISVGVIHPNVEPSPYAQLAGELVDRHIQYGYAGYYHANAVTFASTGRVRIRAVLASDGDRVKPYNWLTNRHWYQSEFFTGPTCLILSPSLRALNVSGLERHYGKPKQVFFAQGMEVLVWPYNISQKFLPGS